MEHIFFAVLALHIVGKPINEDNIRKVLKAAGTPIDEEALKAMAAFVEATQSRRDGKVLADDRILKFLASELSHLKEKSTRIEQALSSLFEKVKVPVHTDAVRTEQVIREQEKPKPDKAIIEEKTVKLTESKPIVKTEKQGRYLYGVTAIDESMSLGKIGIEGNKVYTIPYNGLAAIVHNCPTEPYKSDDQELVKNWVKTHQEVLDVATEKIGTVLPSGFDTIIKPKDDTADPNQTVKDWLKEDMQKLLSMIEKIKGKDEYGIQISYEPEIMSKKIIEESKTIKKLKEEIKSKPKGIAYMYRQKLEKAVSNELEKKMDEYFRDFFHRIKLHSDDIKVEKTKKIDKNKVMIMNLSCLVRKDKAEDLGNELEAINNINGFSVHFSGPWPAYSFVTLPTATESKK